MHTGEDVGLRVQARSRAGRGVRVPCWTSPDGELDQSETEEERTEELHSLLGLTSYLRFQSPESASESGRLLQPSRPSPDRVALCDPRGTEGLCPQGPWVPGRCWLWPGMSSGGALGPQASAGLCLEGGVGLFQESSSRTVG